VTASECIRRKTAAAHRRLERTAFARSLAEKRVARREYVEYLRALLVIVSTVSGEVQRRGTARDRAFLGCAADWLPLLQDDLDALGGAPSPTDTGARAAALDLARRICDHVGADSAYLIGTAYVLVGSHRGNRSVAPAVAGALDLRDGAGTRYLRASEATGDAGWKAFRARLDQTLVGEGEIAEAVRGALDVFAAFERLFAGLEPRPRRFHNASALNREAGDHPIPEDPDLLELSIRVADDAMHDFPYLGFRFGERGGRFARSDGAWLATLCRESEASANRRLEWLGGVLSVRGIPTLCLEHHLRLLHDALRAPGAPPVPGSELLGQLARRLSTRREAVLEGARLDHLAPIEGTPLGSNFAEVLCGAVADQRADVAACADEIRAWAARERRLETRVSKQIGEFVDAALQAVSR
jgi:heme oxygenase